MTASSSIRAVTKGLERALRVIDELLTSVKNINESIVEYERTLVLEESEKGGHLLFGSKSRYVCLTKQGSKDEPMKLLLEELLESKATLPSVILLGRDTKESIRRIETIFRSKIQESERKKVIVLNLRWATMLPVMEADQTVVVGTRYIHLSEETMRKLEKTLIDIGLSVTYDRGEYGGGALTHQIITRLRPMMTLELTLSESVVRNAGLTISLLEAFAKL